MSWKTASAVGSRIGVKGEGDRELGANPLPTPAKQASIRSNVGKGRNVERMSLPRTNQRANEDKPPFWAPPYPFLSVFLSRPLYIELVLLLPLSAPLGCLNRSI